MSDLDSFFAKKDRKKKKRAAPQAKLAAAAPALAPAPAPTAAQTTPVDASATASAVAAPAGAVAPNSAEATSAASPAQPAPTEPTPAQAPAPAQRQDDGWVEFEDPKRQQVNTGGRKVASLKRDSAGVVSQPTTASDEPTNSTGAGGGATSTGGPAADSGAGSEFQGWKASDEVAAEAEKKAAAEKEAAEKAAAEAAAAAKPPLGGVYRPKIWASRGPGATQQGPDVKSVAQFPSLADAARTNAPQVPASMRAQEKGVKSPVSSGRPRFINSKRS